jgi:hypothetical protein
MCRTSGAISSVVCVSVSMSASDGAMTLCCRVLCPAVCVHTALAVAVECMGVIRSLHRVCVAQDAMRRCAVVSLTVDTDIAGALWRWHGHDCWPHTIADAAVCVADEMPPPVIDATSRLTSPCTTCRARRRCPSCSGCCCWVGGATLCLPVPSPTRWRRAAPCTVTQ